MQSDKDAWCMCERDAKVESSGVRPDEDMKLRTKVHFLDTHNQQLKNENHDDEKKKKNNSYIAHLGGALASLLLKCIQCSMHRIEQWMQVGCSHRAAKKKQPKG
jgi:hypothetical protein